MTLKRALSKRTVVVAALVLAGATINLLVWSQAERCYGGQPARVNRGMNTRAGRPCHYRNDFETSVVQTHSRRGGPRSGGRNDQPAGLVPAGAMLRGSTRLLVARACRPCEQGERTHGRDARATTEMTLKRALSKRTVVVAALVLAGATINLLVWSQPGRCYEGQPARANRGNEHTGGTP